jgi:hypothetical protein
MKDLLVERRIQHIHQLVRPLVLPLVGEMETKKNRERLDEHTCYADRIKTRDYIIWREMRPSTK